MLSGAAPIGCVLGLEYVVGFLDGGGHGGSADEDDGSYDSNFNRYHLGLDDGHDGPSRGPSPDDDGFGGGADDDNDSGVSNCNRYHSGLDCCHGGSP